MGAEETETLAPSLTLRDFLQILQRRKTTALITFATVLGLVTLVTLISKPQYRSSAKLMLEEQSNSGGGGGGAAAEGLKDIFAPQSGMAVDSQVELVNSPLILNQVYDQTGIKRDSVGLTVERVEKTNVIEISGVANSRADVEKFVEYVPKVYQDNRRVESAREVLAELNFAKKDLAEESKKLLDTEAAIASFKDKNNLIDPQSEAQNALERATTSKNSLAQARADIASLRAQIVALEGGLADLPATINTPVVTTNPEVEKLRNELADLQSERAAQLFLYKENADPIRQIDRRIATLNARIASTPKTVTTNRSEPNPAVVERRTQINGLRADFSAKQAAEQSLSKEVAAQDAALSRFTGIQLQQAQLQRQLDASQVAVKAGGENVRQLSVRAKALGDAGAPVTVIEPATAAKKIAPRPTRNIALGVFLGVLLACAAALAQDSLDDRVRDEEDARQLLGAPILGYFPLLPVSDERQILDLENPDRVLLETFRALRSNVQFALVNSAGKKLQVTSTVPNEGKSYIASNLAITMALDGRKVILVDSDLHRPTMHERFGLKRQPGLTNVLVGQATVEEALQDAGFPGLRLMSAGALPPNPAELLNSPSMVEVMKELEELADLIIFDTPPLLATSDSQLMSAKMDGVIFVMQMGSVARSGTLRAFELLQQAHANLIGVVFNKVNSKSSVSYDNYSGYYALDADISQEDVLDVSSLEKPPKTLPSALPGVEQKAAQNGVKNGVSTNGTPKNGSNGDHTLEDSTIFDEALASDENPR